MLNTVIRRDVIMVRNMARHDIPPVSRSLSSVGLCEAVTIQFLDLEIKCSKEIEVISGCTVMERSATYEKGTCAMVQV